MARSVFVSSRNQRLTRTILIIVGGLLESGIGERLNISEKIKLFRAYPERKSYKTDLLISLSVALLGALMGYVAKASDSISIIGDIGTGLGGYGFSLPQ